MDAIEIRAATPDDADAVAHYHDRCFKNTYSSQLLAGEFEAPDREGTRRQLRDWFRPESEFETQVAIVDGLPPGTSRSAATSSSICSSSRTTKAWDSADAYSRTER